MKFVSCSTTGASVARVAPLPLIPIPPPAYDHRKQLLERSVTLISQRWPELKELAASGTLVAVPRPEDYVERREDGYREPELILLIGTSHLSLQSAEDVRKVVLTTQPQNVVVELCKSRSPQLYSLETRDSSTAASAAGDQQQPWLKTSNSRSNMNALSLGGGGLLESFQRSVALGGRSAFFLRLLLGNLSSKLSEEVGVSSGAEFRAARAAAEEIGAQIVLGDRPIEVTLRRAWDALPGPSRWKLAAELAEGVRSVQGAGALAAAQAVEDLKDDDMVSSMLSSLGERYPEALPPLVHERDLFFAWSLKRSKAVNGTETVVGVVGRGHMRGVCYALTHDSGQLRFRDLAGSRKQKGDTVKMVTQVVVETALFSAVWYAWTHYPFTF